MGGPGPAQKRREEEQAVRDFYPTSKNGALIRIGPDALDSNNWGTYRIEFKSSRKSDTKRYIETFTSSAYFSPGGRPGPFRFENGNGRFSVYPENVAKLEVLAGISIPEQERAGLKGDYAHITHVSEKGDVLWSFGKITGFGSDGKGDYLKFAQSVGKRFEKEAKIYLKDIAYLRAYGKEMPILD